MLKSAKKLSFIPILSLIMTINSVSAGEISGNASGNLPGRCRIEAPARGECKALFTVYFFNRETNRCEESFYGGCGGIVPFDTEEECRQLCETEESLKLVGLKPFEGFPYLLVEIEYPANWGDPNFFVTIDGKSVKSRSVSGGFSGGVSTKTLAVCAGGNGLKTVEVRAVINGSNHRVRSKRFLDFPEMTVLLDLAGDGEALFDNNQLRFFLFQTAAPRVYLNGKPVVTTGEPDSTSGVFAVTPQWIPGRNTVTIETTGKTGNVIKNIFSFLYLPDVTTSNRPSPQSYPSVSSGYQFLSGARLSVGDRITVPYGQEGSRSGPFFSLRSTDGSVRISEIEMPGPARYSLDKDGWLTNSAVRLWEVKGVHPGRAVLQFMVKRHFLGLEELEKELEVSVVPAQK